MSHHSRRTTRRGVSAWRSLLALCLAATLLGCSHERPLYTEEQFHSYDTYAYQLTRIADLLDRSIETSGTAAGWHIPEYPEVTWGPTRTDNNEVFGPRWHSRQCFEGFGLEAELINLSITDRDAAAIRIGEEWTTAGWDVSDFSSGADDGLYFSALNNYGERVTISSTFSQVRLTITVACSLVAGFA